MNEYYNIELPVDRTLRGQSIAWLVLALGSLFIGGLFVILVVLSRTPGIQDIIPWVNFFKVALVVHVDMTVLVWFLSFAGVLWSLNRNGACRICGWPPIILAGIGMLGIAVSPFLGAGNPIMNNNVPVLQDPFFFVSLGLFGFGVILQILNGFFFSHAVGKYMDAAAALRFGLYTALVPAIIAMMSVGWSFSMIPAGIEGEQYYELLFWGGGHVLQFTHTQLMMVAWLWLASISGVKIQASPRVVVILFALGVAPVLLTPLIYLTYPIESPLHVNSFASMMRYGGGLAVLPLGLILLYSLLVANRPGEENRVERSALYYSIVLFGMGGLIGFMISGSNVRIPAHYHGSIVGVTLAFMGITYHLLPKLGFRKPAGKWVNNQPAIYGLGQLIWVIAMAYTGGHGVQRKMAGAEQSLKTMSEHIGMGIMGVGGIIAIIGGILYLLVVYKAMVPVKQQRFGN